MPGEIILSVLDQSPVRKGGTPARAVHETIELAAHCDRLGYHRYWLAEHHSTSALAMAAPEMLVGEIASRTERIRVGTGGVMLTHYAPLKVAEQFRMLETLYPGRIDLGVGRAPGSDARTAHALAGGRGLADIERYPEQLMDLYGFLAGDLPAGHPFANITAQPAGPSVPELWLLGSTAASAHYAAQLGWPFCFAHFISSEGPRDVFRRYRTQFRPSAVSERPAAAIGVATVCAETDEEAQRLAWSNWGLRLGMARGQMGDGIPSPEEAMARTYSPEELDYVRYLGEAWAVGSPATVRRRLEALQVQYDVDEFVLVTIMFDFEARKRSYELLAREFGLPAAA